MRFDALLLTNWSVVIDNRLCKRFHIFLWQNVETFYILGVQVMTQASKSQRSVTIKDVAKKAETSIATVSYVFSNADRPIRPELRERGAGGGRDRLRQKRGGQQHERQTPRASGHRRGAIREYFSRACVWKSSTDTKSRDMSSPCATAMKIRSRSASFFERLVAQRIDGCILPGHVSRRKHGFAEATPDSLSDSGAFISGIDFHTQFCRTRQLPAESYLATQHLLEAGHRRIAFSGFIPNVW